ncbi:glycoside hydrolase family 3 N-terminal domain-containing protein [Bacillus suaedae]|uniref:Glycoside hydrolase family 3 C-terminal domain-containing protein n=1 Tax=Halalkalibacter suaedae TaxID=2822140 RepID=A0A941APB3_9BACI|nr:glycoside hydrolase family 3 N-terminal domain-containing protein [Bacillus suaedae]MBP3951626.1 glycoside hydrolase family 3 C-terminal domain-containing protein [Bacillus suaedae]
MAKRKMSKKKFRIVWSSILSILLVIAIGANVALGYYSDVITSYFTEIDTTSNEAIAARDHSTEVAQKIADEGIILLQNEENALPFAEGTKVNVFGWSFTAPIYGGAGSGGTDASTAITPKAGLEAAGIEINEELYNAYAATDLVRPVIGIEGQDFTIPEPEPETFYTDELISQAKEFSDTAVLFIARSGGEGADLPQSLFGEDTYDPDGSPQGPTGQKFGFEDDQDPDKHYLELTNRELGMLEAVTENFDNIVLVLNSANTFELDWLKDYDQIKSVVNIAGPGQSGFGSLGQVLAGDLNPSGKTVDIYANDLQDAPAAANFGDFDYVLENADGTFSTATDAKGVPLKYVDLTEGVYVGYRYYETAAAEGSINYDEKVLYPFGYGLSYTTFDQEVVTDSVTWTDTEVSVDVQVTNTGSVAGKEVVQLYYTPPYTGQIERSSVNLAAFGKTAQLEPGQSEVISLSFPVEDMAAYDHNKIFSENGAYVLEAGEYNVMLMSNSHEKIADVASQTLSEVVYNEAGRTTDDQTAVNQFDEEVTGEGSIETYLSRADGFANLDTIDQNEIFTVTNEDGTTREVVGTLVNTAFVDMVNSKRYDVPADTHENAPTTGADNGLVLEDYKDVAYDDESWEPLLDQLTVDDLVNVFTHGGYKTAEIQSVQKPATIDYDGPAGISNFISGSPLSGIPFPAEVMLASTWNIDLAVAMGEAIGKEAQAYGVTGWYGPAMNIHRTAFAGRNFEYYSEDPYLSGKFAAATIAAYQAEGGYVQMKHFALNDQEDNRTLGVLTWGDEQAIREIYLRPFEYAVKEGGALGVMSSFNSIGDVWAGADESLLTEVLRNEWGFRGVVNTDFYILDAYPYMNAELAVRAGNDILLTGVAPFGVPQVNTESNDTLWAMRAAAKNVLYTVANTNAVDDGMSTDKPQWVINTIIIDVIVGLGIILGFFFTFRNSRKRDEDNIA